MSRFRKMDSSFVGGCPQKEDNNPETITHHTDWNLEVEQNPCKSDSAPLITRGKQKNSHFSTKSFTSACYSPKLLVLLLVLCSSLHSTVAKSGGSGEKRVVCYYTNWSAYRQGPAKFLPDNINPYLCTHLIYAFGGLTSDSGIKPFDKYQDVDKGGYTKFNGLKTYNKALKTLIAIGGWNEGSGRFSKLVAEAESRKTFIKHAIRFLRQHHFDGLDLDWEYPAARDGSEPEDKKNYAIFIKELREAFEDESKSTGRNRLLLTIAVPAGIEWIQKGFDIPVINKNVDFFNLLTYDYHASTEPNANHHAPLKAKEGLSEYDWKGQLNIEYSINYYLKEGADPDKLVVGLPTYGRSYTLFNPESYDVGAPSSGPGTKGKYTKEPGYLAYYEICEGVKSGEWKVEDALSDAQGPHAVKDNQWVGYDDTRIMTIKAKWIVENHLGGIMFWSIDNDDFRGACHGKPFPLIEAAKTAYFLGEAPRSSSTSKLSILNKTSSNRNNRFSTTSRRVTTPAPPSTTTGAPTKSSNRRRNKTRSKNRRRTNKKPSKTTTPTTTSTTTSTTTQPPTTYNPLSTPAPPTTPDPGVDFECKEDGFFPHPRECKKYFWCLDAPGLGLVPHHFTCPAGLYFNKNTDSCDYARNVPCKPGGTPTTTTTTTTTTTPKPTTTTTTTTTPIPIEEDEEEYEYEEDEEEEPDAKTKLFAESGRSVKEIKDIKDLLKLIKKLGGVEELEKYLEDNPGIAASVADYEDDDEEEEEEKKVETSSKPSVFATRNRFTTSPHLNRGRYTSATNPVVASSTSPLRYTSIQRVRPSAAAKALSKSDEEDDDKDEDSKATTRKSAAATLSSSKRQKYVTLSRNRTPLTPSPSSTETSVVVRFSDEVKFVDDAERQGDDDNVDDEGTDESSGDTRTTRRTTDKPDRYVTISRPYAKVTGTLENESEEKESSQNNRLRYVSVARVRSPGIEAEETKKSEEKASAEKKKQEETDAENEDKDEGKDEETQSDESEEEESPVEEHSQPIASSPMTTTSTTTESPTSELTTTKPARVRIPTRKSSGLPRSRGTTKVTAATSVTTTTQSPTTQESATRRAARNFAVGNRRNLFLSRTRSASSTPEPGSIVDVESPAVSQAAQEDQSVTQSEVFSRAAAATPSNSEFASESELSQRTPRSKEKLRSRSTTPTTAPNEETSAKLLLLSRSRSRYRSTTESKPVDFTTSRPGESFTNRRRARTTTRKPSSLPTSAATTSTTENAEAFNRITPRITDNLISTNSNKVSSSKATLNGEEADGENDYYYYYYEEDTDSDDLLDKSQTQRTTGLRTTDFTTGGSSQTTNSVSTNGLTKRNLNPSTTISRNSNTKMEKRKSKTTGRGGSTKSIGSSPTSTVASFNAKVKSSEFVASEIDKWSQRAVVPLSEKIRLRGDGTVECLDKGIFPHPISCKQFVHCAPSEENDGSIRSWVYACPKLLTFDPIGGMCNWAPNKLSPTDNACIE